jgi:hypothetical protein
MTLRGFLISADARHDLLLFLIAGLVLFVSFIEYEFLRVFLQKWVSLILVSVQTYCLVYVFLNSIVFAGSFIISRCSTEWHYSGPVIDEIRLQVASLEPILEAMGKDEGAKLSPEKASAFTRCLQFLKNISESITPKTQTQLKFYESLHTVVGFFDEKNEEGRIPSIKNILEALSDQENVKISKEKADNLKETALNIHVSFFVD